MLDRIIGSLRPSTASASGITECAASACMRERTLCGLPGGGPTSGFGLHLLDQVRGYAREAKGVPAAAPASGGTVKIVLLQTIPKLGVKGSVVEANAGWVRHVLFPRRKAVYATPENLEQFSLSAAERAKSEDPVQREQRRLVKLINTLCKCQVNISRRSNWWKKRYDEMQGSVTAWDVIEATERQYGIRLNGGHLMMDTPITSFGTFKVPLNLRTKEDRQVELTVSVNSVRWINHGHAYV